MNHKYILALDQGTTSSRAILFDRNGKIHGVAQQEFEQIFPKPGWVEHNPEEIYSSQLAVLKKVVSDAGIDAKEIAAIGITNQRETTIVWDKKTGKSIHNAIVWQDRRTAAFCDQLKEAGNTDGVRKKTGLVIDAYFSGTKVRWILNNVAGARQRAENGELSFGTVDSWLVYHLSGKTVHVTDATNASRTMLYDITTLKWDDGLVDMLSVPKSMLPKVASSSEIYGYLDESILGVPIPIAGIAGDQQAALFGQMCTEKGMAKNTYGTGCFMVLNTGTDIVYSKNNLLSTIAYQINGITNYALEGSVFIAGAAIQWLRDGLEVIDTAEKSEELAASVEDNGGVYMVPALSGLGAPHWDPYARGSIHGLTRGSTKAHITRAALESICYQVNDVVTSMNADTGNQMTELRVDGGAVANNLLLQFQADVLDAAVVRPQVLETTAQGAAYLAGLAVGFWSSVDDIKNQWAEDKKFVSTMDDEKRTDLLKNWNKAVERSKGWIEEDQKEA